MQWSVPLTRGTPVAYAPAAPRVAVRSLRSFALKVMKQAFEIFKDRPRISLIMTRDSVCAGDDCDAPHERTIELPSFVDPSAFVRHAALGYMPTVAGFGHSWICILNGRRIAELRYDGIRPLVLETVFDEKNTLHWEYRSATH